MNEENAAAALLAEKFASPAKVGAIYPEPNTTLASREDVAATGIEHMTMTALTDPTATASEGHAGNSGESSSGVQAYAKLEGPGFTHYINTLQVTLGRKAIAAGGRGRSSSIGSTADALATVRAGDQQPDIVLGTAKSISRQHARLFYNFMTLRFEMTVFGKNGAFVNDMLHEKGVTVPLEHKSKIQIGDVVFLFLLPKITTDQAGDGSMGSTMHHSQMNGNSPIHSVQQTPVKMNSARSPTSSITFSPEQAPLGPECFSPDRKPPLSYASLIAQAINSTPERRMTLSGIYKYITTHFPYYRFAQNGWQNSIRHNLSLNKAFVKVARGESEPGKGAFWTIDPNYTGFFSNGVFKRSRGRRTTPRQIRNSGSTPNSRNGPYSPTTIPNTARSPRLSDDTLHSSPPRPAHHIASIAQIMGVNKSEESDLQISPQTSQGHRSDGDERPAKKDGNTQLHQTLMANGSGQPALSTIPGNQAS